MTPDVSWSSRDSAPKVTSESAGSSVVQSMMAVSWVFDDTVGPDTAALEALDKMTRTGLTRLMVVSGDRLDGIEELNIGHAIIARAVLVGLDQAVREMRNLMLEVI